MKASSIKKVREMIGSTLRDLIRRDIVMNDQYKIIQEKEKELTALRDKYNNDMNVQDAEYESILEFIELDPSTPRTSSVMSSWRTWFNYHPDKDTAASSDYVMKKIIELIEDKENEAKDKEE